jgi:anti-sigma B factor antagonist
LSDRSWTIIVKDFGKPVEKEKIIHRDLKNIRPGGLGVFIIKKMMDCVEYIRDDKNDLNKLVMKKNIVINKENEMEKVNNIAVLSLQGDVDLYRSPDVRKQLEGYISKKIPCLIVDLKDVSFIDSSGLATLIEAFQKTKKYGGRLYLTGVNEKIRNVFEISRLEDVFTICSDVAEAKKIFKDTV